MAFKVVDCDNVRESFASTGTTITLGGALANSRALASVLSNGDTFWGVARKGAEFSAGIFTYTSAGGTVAQTTPFYTTNSNNAVSFSSGTAGEIFMDAPSRLFEHLNIIPITVTSAATFSVGAVQGAIILASGTTGPVTSFGTGLNKYRLVKWAGATLTCNTTSLVLIGLANGATRVTTTGSWGLYVSDGSSNWTEVFYQPANGKALVSPASTDITDSTSTGRSVLTGTDAPTIRATLSAAQIAAMAMHNVVVNPAMDVSQEFGTTGATLANNTNKYILDGWEATYNHGAATAVFTSAQLAGASFPTALAGFPFGHQLKATTALSSPANLDYARHLHRIEAYRIAHWGWGATGAASIVVAFQLYSTASGTAFVRLGNNAADRFYYHEITVAAGWNFYAFTIAGDTTGTWLATSGVGIFFNIYVSGKEATPQSSLDAWVGTAAKVQTTNSTNLFATNNNVTILTGLYIDIGAQLPVAADLPGLMRNFPAEHLNCMRYYWKTFLYGTAPAQKPGASTGQHRFAANFAGAAAEQSSSVRFTVPMRIAPAITLYNPEVANAQVRDRTASVDCSASGSINVSELATGITATGNASTAVGNILTVHIVADARL